MKFHWRIKQKSTNELNDCVRGQFPDRQGMFELFLLSFSLLLLRTSMSEKICNKQCVRIYLHKRCVMAQFFDDVSIAFIYIKGA